MLRGMGVAVALPWLEAMTPAAPLIANVARANQATGSAPVRMAFLYVPNGMHMNHWKPSGPDPRNYALKPIFKPVEKFRSKMNIISGLSLSGAEAHGDGGGDHARSVASFLTGAHPKKTHGSNIRNGVSVDPDLNHSKSAPKKAPPAANAIPDTVVSTPPISRGEPNDLP